MTIKNRGVIGVGIDIEDISRFRKMSFNKNKEFYRKIFTDNEINYCTKKINLAQHFTARFCAKEAFIKAFPKTSKNKLPNYKDIEILTINGKPLVKYHNKMYNLSISHDKDKAVAVVIIT
ncbi:holo-ACP synthase [Candidatus Woesearchaeota archaeon]|nr:hypothetical protein [uncultured archaeon]MBS3124365.1 holo-ACP synthase [Candidatus Woesearchaeota archaeon]